MIKVVSEVLESAGVKSCEMNDKIFDTLHLDGEKSHILSILTAQIDYAPNLITTLCGRVGFTYLGR